MEKSVCAPQMEKYIKTVKKCPLVEVLVAVGTKFIRRFLERARNVSFGIKGVAELFVNFAKI